MADSNNLILKDNLFFLTSALSRTLSKEADDVFVTMGLSSSHALILLLIYEQPEIQPGQLAKKLYLNPSTITRLVQKLERRQLVEKTTEGRATNIVCTSKGNKIVVEVKERWDELMMQKQEQLGDRYVEVLSEMIANALNTVSSE